MQRTHQNQKTKNQFKTMVQVKFLTTAEINAMRDKYKPKKVNGQTKFSNGTPKQNKRKVYGVTTESKYYRA
jgi:hypothetical protein